MQHLLGRIQQLSGTNNIKDHQHRYFYNCDKNDKKIYKKIIDFQHIIFNKIYNVQ